MIALSWLLVKCGSVLTNMGKTGDKIAVRVRTYVGVCSKETPQKLKLSHILASGDGTFSDIHEN